MHYDSPNDTEHRPYTTHDLSQRPQSIKTRLTCLLGQRHEKLFEACQGNDFNLFHIQTDSFNKRAENTTCLQRRLAFPWILWKFGSLPKSRDLLHISGTAKKVNITYPRLRKSWSPDELVNVTYNGINIYGVHQKVCISYGMILLHCCYGPKITCYIYFQRIAAINYRGQSLYTESSLSQG